MSSPNRHDFCVSKRSYHQLCTASSWEEIWEAGPYYERLAELLEDAREYVIFAGWQIDSRLPMKRPFRPYRPSSGPEPERESLRQKLIRLCEEKPNFQVYLLMWDHAYFYVLEREGWQGRIWDDVHPRVHFVFDNRHSFGASHHEKICIVDGDVALTGGIDVCDERWDSPQHLFSDPRRSLDGSRERHGPYHDLAVQVTGEVCRAIHAHVARRWRALSSIRFPDPPRALASLKSGHPVYVSRTIAPLDEGPVVREVEFLFRDAIAMAERSILLEGQYYWSREVNDMLIAKMLERRGTGFEVLLVLAQIHKLKSLSRQMASHEIRLLERLEATARMTGARLVLGTPYVYPPAGSRRARAKSVYIHSKVLIIDDRLLSIGSANLAARALRVDTEITLTLEARTEAERAHVRRVADQIRRHWLSSPTVKLRPFRPRIEYRHHSWTTRLPIWERFFDPKLPWLYAFKRRSSRLARSRRVVVAYGLILGWVLSFAAALVISGCWRLPAEHAALPWKWTLLLTSSWFLPLPFFAASTLVFLQLPAPRAAAVVLGSFWSAAAFGYTVARMFPSAAARFYRQTQPSWLPERLGLRRFPSVISVLGDPRVSLRSKVAFQGLYCIPVPWFALGTLLVLASATVLFAALASRLIKAAEPELALNFSRPVWLVAIGAYGTAKLLGRLWRNDA